MLPKSLKPMLATHSEPFDSPDFTYEIKWDGYRCLALIDNETRLQSRNEKLITYLFPELSKIHQHFAVKGCLVDGEVIALRNQKPSFLELQKRAQLRNEEHIKAAVRKIPVIYIVFDLLYYDYQPVFSKPLEERRGLLTSVLTLSDELIYPGYIENKGLDYFKTVSSLGLEGVMAKRKGSPYYPGKRVKSWLKFKKTQIKNFIICGFVIKSTTRGELSSLILGAYLGEKLRFFGMVGTGFTQKELLVIQKELSKIATPISPFTGEVINLKNVTWTQPIIPCQVEFLELTDDGHLRHPTFRKFRPDLKAEDCRFEE